jgi:Condensation domain
MWLAQQLDPLNPIYRGAEYIDIHGQVDLALLEVAVRQAVADTEALRVRVEVDDEGIWQLVDRLVDWPLSVLDLQGTAGPWTQAQDWMRADLSRVVDLGRATMFTITVLQLATDRFLLYLSPHQASERFIRDREYWAEQLADRPAAVGLAGRLAGTSHTFLRHTGHVPGPVADQLRRLARRTRASLPALAMAALAIYVHRMTGASDLMLGLPVTSRTGTVARSVPGMVVSQLPLRVQVYPQMGIGDLVRHR